MSLFGTLKGAIKMLSKTLMPQNKKTGSILGKQKYSTYFKRNKVDNCQGRSILGMAKYNKSSGVGRDVTSTFDSREEK